jgi:hypothetical protein
VLFSTVYTWNQCGGIHLILGNRVWLIYSYRAQFLVDYKHIKDDGARFLSVEADASSPRRFSITNDTLPIKRNNVSFRENPFRFDRRDFNISWWDDRNPSYPNYARVIFLPLWFIAGYDGEGSYADPSTGQIVPPTFSVGAAFPHWFALLVAGVVFVVCVRPFWKARKLLAMRGKCRGCGYDLRAHVSGQRCPECGMLVGVS